MISYIDAYEILCGCIFISKQNGISHYLFANINLLHHSINIIIQTKKIFENIAGICIFLPILTVEGKNIYLRGKKKWLFGEEITRILFLQIYNENMPFRCLEYVTRIYEGIVPIKVRYQEKVYRIPNPDFYVVYVGKKEQPLEEELRLSDAFYTKDSSKLELVVKVKNCSNYMNLPISNNCDILKQYCRFLEIVEQNYSKHFKKRSLRHAIEIAKEEGILTDYLDRKAREVTNMLCAKYDYKMDIAVKQEEAREDGKQEKAIEAAVLLVKEYKVSAEDAAKDMNAPLDRVLEKLAEH